MSYENGTTTSAYSVGLLGGSNEVTTRAKLLEECLSIDTARSSSLLLLLLWFPPLSPNQNGVTGSSFYIAFFSASVPRSTLFAPHGVPFSTAHLAYPPTSCSNTTSSMQPSKIPPAGRVHFRFSVLWRLVQSYPRERAESSLLRNGPLEHFLGPQKFVRGLPVGWRLMLASGYERTIGGGPNFH